MWLIRNNLFIATNMILLCSAFLFVGMIFAEECINLNSLRDALSSDVSVLEKMNRAGITRDRLFAVDKPQINPLLADILHWDPEDVFVCIGALSQREFSIRISEMKHNGSIYYLLTLVDVSPLTTQLLNRKESEIPENYSVNWNVSRTDVFVSKADVDDLMNSITPILNQEREAFQTDDYMSGDFMFWRTKDRGEHISWRMSNAPYAGASAYLYIVSRALLEFISYEPKGSIEFGEVLQIAYDELSKTDWGAGSSIKERVQSSER